MKVSIAIVSALAVAAAASAARATVLSGPVDTIYSDTFAAPAVNVNAAGVDPNSIAGNVPAVSTGLDGGSATATYIGSAQQPAAGTGNPDAVWDYSGSNSATITSPSANVNTTGNIGEDAHTIDNLTLPLIPVVGMTYDLEITMSANKATGGHGLEMAFLWNNGNGHNAAVQAISNNDPVGLILDRDAISNTTTGGYFDIFESTGTGADNNFPNASSTTLAGTTPGSPITVDSVFTPTGTGTTGTMSWYINGVLVNATPVAVTGLTNGIADIQFGTNQDSGTLSNFSLTAQAVPEPASLSLLALGAAGLIARRRR